MFFIYYVTIKIGESMKKILIFIIIAISFLCIRVNAKETVEKYIDLDDGYIYSNEFWREFFVQTSDDCLITIDDSPINTGSPNSEISVIQKIDKYGNIIWTKKIDTKEYGAEFNSGIELPNNNIVLAGTTYDWDNNKKTGRILIINPSGEIQKNIIVSGEHDIEIRSVILADNNNYVIVGQSNSPSFFNIDCDRRFGFILEYSYEGEILKQNTFLEDYDLDIERAIKTINNNYIVKSYFNLYKIDSNLSNIIKLDIYNATHQTSLIFESRSKGFYLFVLDYDHELDLSYTYIAHYNDDGTVLKDKRIEIDEISWISNIFESTDNGYLLIVQNDSMPDLEYKRLIKMDSEFNLEWIDESQYFYTADQCNNIFLFGNEYTVLNSSSENGFNIKIIDNNKNNIFNKSYNQIFLNNGAYYQGIFDDDKSFVEVGENIDGDGIYGILVKYDQSGKNIFKKTIRGCNLKKITKTSDSGYLVSGYAYSNEVIPQLGDFLIKFDKDGNILWYKTRENTELYTIDCFYEGNNNEYLIAGSKQIAEDYFIPLIIKLNKNGNIIWSKELDTATEIKFIDIKQINNNRILVSGRYKTDYYSYGDSFFAEYDNMGNLVSNSRASSELGYTKKILNFDNNHYIKIRSIESGITEKLYISMLDNNDNIIWEKEYINNSTLNFDASVYNSTLYIAGSWYGTYSSSPSQNENYLIAYDKNGELIKNRSINNPYNERTGTMHLEPNVLLNVYGFSDGSIRVAGCGSPMEGPNFPFLYDIYYRYDITPKSSLNGTFTVDKIKARDKEIITINAKPKLGYIVDKIILTDTKGNKTEFRDLSFEMIPDDVEVEVVFRELINPKTGFSVITIITMITGLVLITIKSKQKTLTN